MSTKSSTNNILGTTSFTLYIDFASSITFFFHHSSNAIPKI